MGRWRAPRPRSSNYISPSGAEKLKQELHHLWKVERPEVTKVVSAAAKNGDRSENGDYIYGKKRLREIDSRVRYLTQRLGEIKIVGSKPSSTSKVYFGARVQLINIDNDEHLTVTLLGADEIDSKENIISIDSPLAQQLLGKTIDDEITLCVADKAFNYSIEQINYS